MPCRYGCGKPLWMHGVSENARRRGGELWICPVELRGPFARGRCARMPVRVVRPLIKPGLQPVRPPKSPRAPRLEVFG